MAKIRFAGKEIALPQSKWVRMAAGILLILGGIVGFLPVLGFWMVPLGLLVLSVDLPIVRRWRRSLQVKWEKWRRGEARGNGAKARAQGAEARPD